VVAATPIISEASLPAFSVNFFASSFTAFSRREIITGLA